MSESVDLYLAFGWVCPECGENQYVSGVTEEMSDEDREDILEALGFESLSQGEFVDKPDSVVCRSCESEFVVSSPDSDDEYWETSDDEDWGDDEDDWDDDDWDDRGV